MRLIEAASAQLVLQAFRDDQKVRAISTEWPGTFAEQIALLRKAQRPVDNIIALIRNLYELDKDELLSMVFPVWVPKGQSPYSWSLGDMVAAVGDGRFQLPRPNSVSILEAAMRKTPPAILGPLIGYGISPERIFLEDGHNRLTAAAIAGVLPSTVTMFVGTR